MNTRDFWTVSLLAVAAVLWFHGAADAQKHTEPTLHFSLELPGGWEVMPAADLQQANAAAKMQSGPPISYSTGFRPRGRKLGTGAPYILVQFIPMKTKGLSHDDMERNLARDTKIVVKGMKQAEGEFRDVMKNAALDSMIFDRTRNRYVLRVQMDVAGAKVQGISVGHIGSQGVVMVHCYSIGGDFPRQLPTFERINDSFQYDPGFEFRSSSRWNFGQTMLLSSLGGALVGCFIGGVGFAIYCFARGRRGE